MENVIGGSETFDEFVAIAGVTGSTINSSGTYLRKSSEIFSREDGLVEASLIAVVESGLVAVGGCGIGFMSGGSLLTE